MAPDFCPTMGYDWEIPLLKANGEWLTASTIQRFVDELAAELPYTHSEEQDGYYEHKVGACSSFAELYDRTAESLTRIREKLKAEDALPFASGACPTSDDTFGCHLHSGTYFDPEAAFEVRNALTAYTPAIAALMANSPYHLGDAGEQKSYRLARQAWGNACVGSVPDPAGCAMEWGADIGSRMPNATLECRSVDSPLSWQLVCECATLLCGFSVTLQGDTTLRRTLTPERMREYTENRFRAVRHGLQATFLWDGEPRSAGDLLGEVLALSQDALRELGFPEKPLIVRMVEKRQTQADMQLALMRVHADPGVFVSVYARASARTESFEDYLDRAPALPLVEPDDVQAHLTARIGRDTPRQFLEHLWPTTAAARDAYVEGLEAGGVAQAHPVNGHVCLTRGRGAARAQPRRPALELIWYPGFVQANGGRVDGEVSASLLRSCASAVPDAYPTGDWGAGIGVGAPSLSQLRERLTIARDWLRHEAERRDARLYLSAPCSGGLFTGLGVVPLSPASYAEAHRAFGAMRPYLPALQALMANHFMPREPDVGPAKCLHGLAWHWAERQPLPPPGHWCVLTVHNDAISPVRHFGRRLVLVSETFSPPTSLELAAECALLLSALVRAKGRREYTDGSVRSRIEFAENWLDACLYGLQATFAESGAEVPAAEVVSRCIEEAAPALADYGAGLADLDLIRRMLAKRQTQADMQIALDSLGGGPADKQARRARATERDGCFEEYLDRASVLGLKAHQSLEDWVLRLTGVETPGEGYARRIEAPLTSLFAVLRRLHDEGRVRVRYDGRYGPVVSRVG